MTIGTRRASILGALLLSVLLSPASRAGTLPSRDPRVVVPLLQGWHEHDSSARLKSILGAPDTESLSGILVTTFRLTDGTTIYVQSGNKRIYSISRSKPGGLAQKLYTPMARDLDHPVPASAPF